MFYDAAPLAAGTRRCIIVYVPPPISGAPNVLSGIRQVARTMHLSCRDIMSPFRQRFEAPLGQEHMRTYIYNMLNESRLTKRFGCDKFSYALIQDVVVVGFANGSLGRVNATLLGMFLTSLERE